jgi:enediyne biosynthesis protein E4
MKSLYCCWFFGALLAPAQGKAAQADTAPGDAVPLDAPSRLAYRQRAQLKSATAQKAFHDFRFTDRTADSGIAFHSHCVEDVGKNNKPIHYDHGCGIAVADIDGDGLPDIYFVSQLGGNELWRNLGKGKFENITASAGVGLSDRICVSASFADVDNDGLPDLFVTTVRGGNVLFHNLGGGKFKDVSHEAGVDYVGHSSGAVFFDFDNDGWLDLLTVNGLVNQDPAHVMSKDHPFPLGQRKQLFRNTGGQFEDVTDRAGAVFKLIEAGRGAAFGDIDNDGDTDVLVGNGAGPTRLLVNSIGARKHWVGLRLVNSALHRDMLGARVAIIRASGPALWRRARADGSYASASDPRVLVGLGDSTAAPRVRVLWPDGKSEEWSSVPIDRYTTLTEGTAK